jgi:hypothetical protein
MWNHGFEDKNTLIHSAPESGLKRMSVFKSCRTKSMTGSYSKKDVIDMKIISNQCISTSGYYLNSKLSNSAYV